MDYTFFAKCKVIRRSFWSESTSNFHEQQSNSILSTVFRESQNLQGQYIKIPLRTINSLNYLVGYFLHKPYICHKKSAAQSVSLRTCTENLLHNRLFHSRTIWIFQFFPFFFALWQKVIMFKNVCHSFNIYEYQSLNNPRLAHCRTSR